MAIKERPQLRRQLWSNARRLYQGLAESGYQLGPQASPVIAVMLKSPHEGLAVWRALIEKGVYVNLVLPPATPGAVTLVRCSVSAAHTPEQIDQIIEAFASLRGPMGLVTVGA
ncbi:8-amino-7-oxononanoate synthase [compost metagenome]